MIQSPGKVDSGKEFLNLKVSSAACKEQYKEQYKPAAFAKICVAYKRYLYTSALSSADIRNLEAPANLRVLGGFRRELANLLEIISGG